MDSEEELMRQDIERAKRNLTPDQEELLELDRRRGEVRKEIIALNGRLSGFNPSETETDAAQTDRGTVAFEGIPHHPPSEHEAQILRERIATLMKEEAQLTAQIDQLEADTDADAAK